MSILCERDDIQSGKKPRGKVRKPFAIECRFKSWGPHSPEWREWGVWRRYETRRQQEQAFEVLQAKWKSRGWIQFRIPE